MERNSRLERMGEGEMGVGVGFGACFELGDGFLCSYICRPGPRIGRWRQAVSWRLCRLETAGALWVLCRLTDGAYPLRGKSLFCLPSRGQNHFFFCWAKEKAVLDSEKEKVDQWKSWGGAVQPDVGFVLLWYPSGEGLWGIPFVSGGLRLSDPWSLLRHCR